MDLAKLRKLAIGYLRCLEGVTTDWVRMDTYDLRQLSAAVEWLTRPKED